MNHKVDKDSLEEQVFFDDPAIDGLLGMLMTLATEHYVLRDRVQILEQLLVGSGHVDPATLAAAPSAEEAAAAQADAAAFARELLMPLLGLQKTGGAGGRFSLKGKGGRT
jgi:hypothetical protein